jgi:hypothetical protein
MQVHLVEDVSLSFSFEHAAAITIKLKENIAENRKKN